MALKDDLAGQVVALTAAVDALTQRIADNAQFVGTVPDADVSAATTSMAAQVARINQLETGAE